MGKITIEGSAKTPTVSFDPDDAVMELKGRSIPENSIEFYKPVVDALEEYSKEPKEATEINIQLEYFNTSSSKCILDLFKKTLKQSHPYKRSIRTSEAISVENLVFPPTI